MFIFCAWKKNLNLGSAKCLVAQTSLDRLHVWVRSEKSGVKEGGCSLCLCFKSCVNMSFYGCVPVIMGSPRLSLSLQVPHVISVTVTFLQTCSYCPCTVIMFTSPPPHVCFSCRSATSPLKRSTPWRSSTNLRWSSDQILPSFGKRGTSWLFPVVPGWCRCAHIQYTVNPKAAISRDNKPCWTYIIKHIPYLYSHMCQSRRFSIVWRAVTWLRPAVS